MPGKSFESMLMGNQKKAQTNAISTKAQFKANIKSKFKQATSKCAILEQGS